ncbi:DAK2 domain-containing protein [Myceligenerans indicum]|uniref:DAK2 domain-containing protein n=1 Tax=Myceligenerans indicum TaxID=2593663 RepID=A0ABS1LP20_9MICO|nr:DAK2 domain-containing protein [Myceligenerans indicum]MBL0888001.1 DAK2 domain-containing protein [Myceligenerans indicum]
MTQIDAGLVRRWVRGATDALRRERAALDRVNVFPVADADTGTNMYLTIRESDHAVRAAPGDASGVDLLATAARAALLGARGNSGVILSEWLRGAALAAREDATAATVLEEAARSARAAVASPADGTILTTADAAATAGRTTEDAGGGPGAVTRAAVGAARTAARTSMTEHPVLAAAGVLDAGACGLVLVLGAFLAATVSDSPGTMEPVSLDLVVRPRSAAAYTAPEPAASAPRPGAGPGALELMFVLTRDVRGAGHVAPRLRSRLEEVGDSVVVVGGDTGGGTAVWQAHVHTDRLPDALAVAAGSTGDGTLAQVHVRNLEAADPHEWGVVALAAAPALAADLAHAGAVVLLTGGFDARLDAVTPDDVQRAAASTGARRALVLGDLPPASPDTFEPRSGDNGGDLDEIVVLDAPTDVHVVVGLAALGTAPDTANPHDVVRAALDGLRVAGPVAAPEAVAALVRLAGAAEPPEVVTALLDDDAAHVAGELTAALAREAPAAELVVLPTGRPGTAVRLGAEPAHAVSPAPEAPDGTADPGTPVTAGRAEHGTPREGA